MVMLLNLKFNKIIEILKSGGVGVMPTDTLYGLVGSAFSKQAIERIYKIKNRDVSKPLIVLISKISDLKKFDICNTFHHGEKCLDSVQSVQSLTLNKFWPGKVSIILPCASTKFKYLHRGTKSIAFRFPKSKSLIEVMKKTGPLVAPSANPEGLKPAENIKQAKKYFKDAIDFYLSSGTLKSKPSAIIKFEKNGEIKILRGITR